MKTGPKSYPETPARNYQYTPSNKQEDRGFESSCKQQIISPTATECMEQTTMLKHDLAQLWDRRSVYLFGNEAQQDALVHWHISFICIHNSTGYSRRVALTVVFFCSVKYLGRSTQFPPGKRAEKCAGLHWKVPSMYSYFHQTYNEFTNVRYDAAFGSSWHTLKVSQLVSSTQTESDQF